MINAHRDNSGIKFGVRECAGKFDGADYVPARDDVRLAGQMQRVFSCMQDGKWRSLRQISDITNAPEASVSAHLRSLRKQKFGGFEVARQYEKAGLYFYKLKVKPPEGQLGLL